MLYLFDIDGTLLDTGGAGMSALQEATREIFGHDGPALDLAGSTDLGIVANIHDHFKIDPTADRVAEYFAVYQRCLDWNLASGLFKGQVFNGVIRFLDELSKRSDATLGLLTGNTSGGAASKMRHFALASYFPFGAFGCDHPDRNQLGPIALSRAAAHTGRIFTPEETLIVGDTPKDIACAHAIGAKCLAVSTGQFTSAALTAYGADYIVESLDQALHWI